MSVFATLALRMPAALLTAAFCLTPARADTTETATQDRGRTLYEFYCYQCHAYGGDAHTLAATFLEPQPRDFTRADPDALTRAGMIDAVTHGRPGTAMVSFASQLNPRDIEQVVDYVRARFMSGAPAVRAVYHTEANGWNDHDRFAAAFPFATGDIALSAPVSALTPAQRAGRRLFLGSCISCHDHARADDSQPVWETRALSYPRRHYDHTHPDSVSGASPYAVHDRPPPVAAGLSAEANAGKTLFEANCAFCHGADGSGRNWIGSFLEPHPRDLTAAAVAQRDPAALRDAIANGLSGTSMPAWKHVLTGDQIEAVVAYLQCCLADPRRELDTASR